MGMVVRSNIMAVNANRQLGMNNSQVTKSLEKLASGFKINRAGDDASGLAISEKMKAQIKGLETASANSQDGISLIQTAEGALTEVHSMLNRMVELAGKSANGTIQDAVDRDNIQNEVNALISEIDRIGDSTNFNGINLIDGNLSGSGSGASTQNVTFKGPGTLVNSTPTASTYKANALGANAPTTAKAGDKYSFSVAIDGGKTHTFEFTYGADAAGDITQLIASDGSKYTITDGAPTAAQLGDAVIGEVNKKLGETFTASNNAGTITLTANEMGSSTPKIAAFGENQITAAGVVTAEDQAVTATTGTDKFKMLDVTSLKVFDGTNESDAVFTVNGKKFAAVASTATDAITSKLGSDVTFIKMSTAATAPVAADRTVIAETISQKTGMNIKADGTKSINLVDMGTVGKGGGLTLQVGDTADKFNQVTVSVDDMRAQGLGVAALDVSSQEAAKTAIATIKEGINKVSTNRGNLGALQNRLEYTINNLDVTAENMSAANSRVRDTDMAKQMMDYTKMNVLNQAAQAMLAQANQQPQSILQLLQ